MVIQPNPPKASKEMIFEWCKGGKHDKCRTQYGGDRIICVCDCADHGINYEPISKHMTEEEVKASIDSINIIMTGDAGDGMSVGNRALQPGSSVWGDQVREGNQTIVSYSGKGNQTSYATNANYYYKEAHDATTIEELETRRSKPVTTRSSGTYQFTGGTGPIVSSR